MLAPLFEPTVASVFAPRTAIDADGTVEGYASLFGEIDQARDMVMRGAFADTLASRGVQRIPMLFQHDPSEPVGIWLELHEDHRGLFARGRLIPEVTRGRELLSLMRAGALAGLLDGVSHRQSPYRSAHAYPSHLCDRPLGNLHRHIPDVDRRTRAQRQGRAALTAAHQQRPDFIQSSSFPKNLKSSMTRFSWWSRTISMSPRHRCVPFSFQRACPTFRRACGFPKPFQCPVESHSGAGRCVGVPPDEGDQREDAESQHFPYVGLTAVRSK